MQIKDDGWRGYMVGKQALNPAHPGAKFTIGSLDTLAGDIHEDLINFFDTQYSADQMGLVVISDRTLDAMEALIRPLFGKNPRQRHRSQLPHRCDVYRRSTSRTTRDSITA